ncbi:Flagellar L-ring protein 1 [uncultured Gammaproteobacteria bacterium]
MFTVQTKPSALKLLMIGAIALALPGCNTMTRMSEVGNGPGLSKIEDPHAAPGYTPVSMPMPKPQPTERNPNSLWRGGSRAFFKDQRANQVGDLLTILIQIADKAKLNNTSTRSRANDEHLGLPNLLGIESAGANLGESALNNVFTGATAADLFKMSSTTNNSGTGAINRDETVNLTLAAIVIQVLPNGNLVVQGKQEVRVNNELRDLNITGVVRPEDIKSDNTINYQRIAEARISYGGRGMVSDVQQPRWGQQIFDIISPF